MNILEILWDDYLKSINIYRQSPSFRNYQIAQAHLAALITQMERADEVA